MTNYNCIGKTLSEIAKETPISFRGGYSVFLLQDETDTTGKEIDISYSIMAILKKHPEIANYKVKFENDFYGTMVLRVTIGVKMTNYEHIKNMSVEEMAKWLAIHIDDYRAPYDVKEIYRNAIDAEKGKGVIWIEAFKQWLESEVSE